MSFYEPYISRARDWLLHSGIQEPGGGVARYYKIDEGRNEAVSTEITGYQASSLAWMGKLTGNREALERAEGTCRFLLEKAWDAELETFPFEYPEVSPTYFFDCGIIARGLLANGHREAAARCARRMAEDFDAGFDFHPVLELPGKRAALRDARWSRSSGCYQLKAALAFHECGVPRAWQKMLGLALDGHEQFLPGHTDEERVMDRLHAYCYFLEALLVAAQGGAAARAVAIGVQRVAYLLHKIAPRFVRSDVYAQLLRVRIYANARGMLALDKHTAALEAEQLVQFQLTGDDARVRGAFCFGRKGGAMLPYANPVSTGFAAQALYLWHLTQTGAALPPVAELV